MENERVVLELPLQRLEDIFKEIRVAISQIERKYGGGPDSIIISLPKYLMDVLAHRRFFQDHPEALSIYPNPTTFYGCPIQPNYENNIVVFHEDMPRYSDTEYFVISLK